MSSKTLLGKSGNIFSIPAPLPFKSPGLRPARRYVPAPNLRMLSGTSSNKLEDLYAYAIRNQKRTESVERLAFAALAGSAIAGILSVFI